MVQTARRRDLSRRPRPEQGCARNEQYHGRHCGCHHGHAYHYGQRFGGRFGQVLPYDTAHNHRRCQRLPRYGLLYGYRRSDLCGASGGQGCRYFAHDLHALPRTRRAGHAVGGPRRRYQAAGQRQPGHGNLPVVQGHHRDDRRNRRHAHGYGTGHPRAGHHRILRQDNQDDEGLQLSHGLAV